MSSLGLWPHYNPFNSFLSLVFRYPDPHSDLMSLITTLHSYVFRTTLRNPTVVYKALLDSPGFKLEVIGTKCDTERRTKCFDCSNKTAAAPTCIDVQVTTSDFIAPLLQPAMYGPNQVQHLHLTCCCNRMLTCQLIWHTWMYTRQIVDWNWDIWSRDGGTLFVVRMLRHLSSTLLQRCEYVFSEDTLMLLLLLMLVICLSLCTCV